MADDERSPRSKRRNGSAEDEKRSLPAELAGGVEGVPAFLLASEEEIRDAYRQDLHLIAQVGKFANECISMNPVGSERWLEGARRIDALRDAIDIHGWVGARRARCFLLSAVDDALQHELRTKTYGTQLQVIDQLGWRDERTLSPQERSRVYAALREVGPNFPTYNAVSPFREVSGKAPADDIPLFAAYLFRRRCPQFARGLVTREGMAALVAAVASWSRPKGRPKKGDTTLPKWEACDALMKAAGLVGSNPDSLEADWKAWNTRRNKGG